ncbi:MAG: extracellular solute-binding protein family 1 [Paenibacillaceae bacterium]|nr:extracellular solute-binding protein family 1 [Paenibacillaceae bacterium]
MNTESKGLMALHRKKKLAAGLALTMLLAVAATGCSSGEEGEASSPPPPASSLPSTAPAADKALQLPIVTQPLTLTYFIGLGGNATPVIKNQNEIAAYQVMEKKTGIHIDFQPPANGQDKEQLSIMLASNNYTDMIDFYWVGGGSIPGGAPKALKDGVIIRLNELIDQHAPNFKKLLADHPEYKKMISDDDGNIYAFPFLRTDPLLLTSAGPWVRQDWLDKLGLSMPVTIDDWHTVLKAFKEKDPNGNGKADELPFTIAGNTKFWFDRTSAFVGAWGIASDFYQDNGKVKYGPVQPEFKSFLQTLNTWFKEGLIDVDYAVTDGKMMDAKITGNLLGSGFTAVGSGIGKYAGLMADKDSKFKLVGTPLPVLKAGDKLQLMQKDFAYSGSGTAITKKNKYPVETVKWLDYHYSEEGSMLLNFGIEGQSYKLENGYPMYTEEVTKNPNGLAFANALSKYTIAATGGAFGQDRRYFEQFAALPVQQESLKNWAQAGSDKMMPLVTSTQEESARLASIMNDVNTYMGEMFNKFVMGLEPIDQFDKFVQKMKSMGIDEAAEINQRALERYNKR